MDEIASVQSVSRAPLQVAVLIVGAGPTGLTLACELARRNVAFRLVEASESPQRGSRGKGLQPRSLEVFEDLGVADLIVANGRMGMPMRVTAPDGRTTVRGDQRPEPRPDMPYPTSLITPEWRIEEALRAKLVELGGAVEFGSELRSFATSDEEVLATVAVRGAVETVAARWLVGCDGGHSLVRKQAGIAFEGETREDVRMIVADVEVEGLDRDAWHIWSHDEGLVALCPLPSTTVFQLQASISPNQDGDLTLPNMQEILERRSGRSDIRLCKPEWSTLWRANVRLAEHYRRGRVFLAGDAAHIHSPAGGQGMNTGVQDAQNLGWKLAAVDAGAPEALLDTYEAERQPVAVGVLALSDDRLRQATEQKSLAAQRDARTTQLDLSYQGSVLARDDRDDTAALRAGDRAPDATMLATADGPCRLFDLTRGGRFTLLDFGGATVNGCAPAAARVVRVVAHATRPGEVADLGGHLARGYCAMPRTIVLIRPDGYIGFISDGGDVGAVNAYVNSVLEPMKRKVDQGRNSHCRRAAEQTSAP